MKTLFVTGTDTNVGKTLVSTLLLNSLGSQIKTSYFKPIQSGLPSDTDWVKAHTSTNIDICRPSYSFEPAMAPHRAAELVGEKIELKKIISDFREIQTEMLVIEGAGGLFVPLNDQEDMIDLIKELKAPVVLVTSSRLGTINHTLLSVKALELKGIHCHGIIINGEPDPGLAEILEQKTKLPILFELKLLESLDPLSLEREILTNAGMSSFTNQLLSQKSSDLTCEKLQQIDQQVVWHPFTQHGMIDRHPIVLKGQGSSLFYNDQWVIDGISSWWVNLLGHSHPELSMAVSQQAHELEHVIFAGFTHEPAILLSQKLVDLAGSRGAALSKVFFSDNGSTSVEVALKMAYQYFQQKGETKRTKFLALKGSYHGDTLGAMSVGEREGFNQVFTPLMFDVDFVDPFNIQELTQAFDQSGEQYAACIVEPMVQGASGMRMYSPEFLDQLSELAKKSGTLIICDEVFTGFYRTGKLFAFEHSQLKPDLLCLSKGLTGGYLPLSVTMARQEIFDQFLGSNMRQAFLHGHSYTANPIACRVALKTLEILLRDETLKKIDQIISWTTQALEEIHLKCPVCNVRQLGTIGAMEVFDENPNYFKGHFSNDFNKKAIERGVLLRPLGGTVYSVPPYCISQDEIKKIYNVIEQIITEGI